jgi:serine protease DegQ
MHRIWLIFAQAVTVALAGFFVVSTLKPDWLAGSSATTAANAGAAAKLPASAPSNVISSGTVPTTATPSQGALAAAQAPVSFSAAAKRAAPAVVSIAATKAPTHSVQSDDPWLRFFQNDRALKQHRGQTGVGSGVIVSAQGYLLTNHHVIDGADDIEVQLTDGRSATAKVIGTDPESDVAVLKIELDRLPVITMGSVEALQVGDPVLAIGNPFGVGQTVTSGIVSALGRSQLGINTFENFIQTDAAINPGNSGGALVDAQGHLVGINTAIYSRSGGNLGIGFAIPANAAQQVLESLVRDGAVMRGWIGVEPRELTPELAQSLKLTAKQGVLITGVLQNGPAAKGGLQPGDVVMKVGGASVTTTAQLLNAVAALKPKSDAVVVVQRGDRVVDLNVSVAQRPRVRAE